MAETKRTSNDSNGANDGFKNAEQHASNAANALDARLSGPLAPLEQSLDDVFGSKAQYQLPANIKQLLVDLAPWLALIGGLLGLWSAYTIWKWAHRANEWIDSVYDMYGGLMPARQSVDLGLFFWLSIAMTVLFAVLALLAFPGLKTKKKVGWNLMFYSLIANILYGIVSLFYSGGGVSSLLGAVVSSAIGLYLLFQVRSHYLVKK